VNNFEARIISDGNGVCLFMERSGQLYRTLSFEKPEVEIPAIMAALQEHCPNEQRILTCVYCGMHYPPGTPSHGAQVLTDHIRVCEKHPMRKLEEDRQKLIMALAGLVGSIDSEELKAMRTATEIVPLPADDRSAALNAIDTLIDLLPTIQQ